MQSHAQGHTVRSRTKILKLGSLQPVELEPDWRLEKDQARDQVGTELRPAGPRWRAEKEVGGLSLGEEGSSQQGLQPAGPQAWGGNAHRNTATDRRDTT